MVKAECTSIARDVTRLAREAMGGNGILLENQANLRKLPLDSLNQ